MRRIDQDTTCAGWGEAGPWLWAWTWSCPWAWGETVMQNTLYYNITGVHRSERLFMAAQSPSPRGAMTVTGTTITVIDQPIGSRMCPGRGSASASAASVAGVGSFKGSSDKGMGLARREAEPAA